jgi:hypothetical protein
MSCPEQSYAAWCNADYNPGYNDSVGSHTDHTDTCSNFSNASECGGTYYVDDGVCVNEVPYDNWNNHSNTAFVNWPNNIKTDFFNWPNHSNQAWQNHPFSNTPAHDDTWCDSVGHGHQNWPDFNQCNGPVRYPDCTFINSHANTTFCETTQIPGHPDAFQEIIFDNWPNHINMPFSNWSDHSNTDFINWPNHTYTSHIDFCNHSDLYS